MQNYSFPIDYVQHYQNLSRFAKVIAKSLLHVFMDHSFSVLIDTVSLSLKGNRDNHYHGKFHNK